MATSSSSSIVIKVMFGEKLSRFTASIDDKKLDLDIVMLSDKIRRLFSFGPDVQFSMTYVDEDGDVVTLAHDDDLLEVVRQSLNPLRITVKLIDGNKHGGSSGTSALLGFPFNPFQSLNPLHYQQQLQYQAINPQVSAPLNSAQVRPWFQHQTLNSGTFGSPKSPPHQLPKQALNSGVSGNLKSPPYQLPNQAVNSGVSGNLKSPPYQLPNQTLNSGVSGNLKSPPYQLPNQTVNYQVSEKRKSVHDRLPWATDLKEETDDLVVKGGADPIGGALNVDDQQDADSESSTLKNNEDDPGGSSGTYVPLGFPFSPLENLNRVRFQPQLQYETLNSEVSSPSKSPLVQPWFQFQTLNSGVSGNVKSVRELLLGSSELKEMTGDLSRTHSGASNVDT